MRPKMSFFEIIKEHGFPNRFKRFCCSYLKEYKVLDNSIQGIRRCESTRRAERYKEPVICRYGNKKNHVNVLLPILEWSDKDVEAFIKLRKIQCHPLYYDAEGRFHVERRLGCIGCPMQSDNGISDFKRHPKFLRRMIQCGQIYLDTHPNVKSRRLFRNVYNLVYFNLFCKTMSDYLSKTNINLFGERLDCKKYLEDYFKIEL